MRRLNSWEKEVKAEEKKLKKLNRNEMRILKFMLKTDVKFYHHNTSDSFKNQIKKKIEYLKTTNKYYEYNQYIWNYQNGNSYMQLSLLGCLWHHNKFESINDVPLTGEYIFYIFDSGQRGLGSFSRITACKVEEHPYIPKVEPGAMVPITF